MLLKVALKVTTRAKEARSVDIIPSRDGLTWEYRYLTARVLWFFCPSRARRL